jgi:hypothetical protein
MAEPFKFVLKRCGVHNPESLNFPEKWIAAVVGYKGAYVFGRSEDEAIKNVNKLIEQIKTAEEVVD